MDDRGRIALFIGLGAVAGGLAGFLFFTDRGRALQQNFGPRLDELMSEVEHLRTTFDRARAAVADGVKSFNQLVSEERRPAGGEWPRAAETHRPPR